MTGAEIAECLGMALSTVAGILTRIGLGKLSRFEPPEPPNRYERERPGELIHIDVKKLARIAGWAIRRWPPTSPRSRAEGGPGNGEISKVLSEAALHLAHRYRGRHARELPSR